MAQFIAQGIAAATCHSKQMAEVAGLAGPEFGWMSKATSFITGAIFIGFVVVLCIFLIWATYKLGKGGHWISAIFVGVPALLVTRKLLHILTCHFRSVRSTQLHFSQLTPEQQRGLVKLAKRAETII